MAKLQSMQQLGFISFIGFLLLWEKKAKIGCWCLFCSESLQKQWAPQTVRTEALFPRTKLSISPSSHHSFEMDLWVSVLDLNLFCASVSKVSPEVIASCFVTFQPMKGFLGMLCFSWWQNLYLIYQFLAIPTDSTSF